MDENKLRESFESRIPVLDKVGKWVVSIISEQLEAELNIKPLFDSFFQLPVKNRVKDVDSFLEKALIRKKKDDPLVEIHDQVGIRFVVLTLDDISKVGKAIQAGPWKWSKDRDHEQERLEKPDYFAYQSDHYVIHTKNSFTFEGLEIPEGIPCEIQIRTLLQHGYAQMAHNVDYKPSIKLPMSDQQLVKRSLSKGSALIETTDDVFKQIKDRMYSYSESTDALLVKSNQLYKTHLGEECEALSALGQLIADTYRELLRNVSPEDLEKWWDDRKWLSESIAEKRNTTVFYRDSVVLLLGFLITENQISIPKLWPIDNSYLEDYYSVLGISIEGLF